MGRAILIVLLCALPALASDSLEQDRVQRHYNDGNFDAVLDLIGRFRNQNRIYSRDDSIFIAKHLAVVYAANPKSVDKGMFWMNELLKLMPAADLVGMYVSYEIDRIFDNVRKEFLARQNAFGVDTAAISLPPRPSRDSLPVNSLTMGVPASESAGEGRGHSGNRSALKRTYWILGGTVVAAAVVGVTVYLVTSPREGADEREITIPRNLQGN